MWNHYIGDLNASHQKQTSKQETCKHFIQAQLIHTTSPEPGSPCEAAVTRPFDKFDMHGVSAIPEVN